MADFYASRATATTTGSPFGAATSGWWRQYDEAPGLFSFVAIVWRRRRFRALLDLEDRMLDDIGLTRPDIIAGLKLPLRTNAAVEVRRMKRLEKARQR